MKRIINGKVYNTETAVFSCGVGPGGYGRNDFRYEDTRLYRTAKGAWFLAGDGGPASRWRKLVGGNSYSGGSGLRVIEEDHARELLEQHDEIDAIEKYFTVEAA